MRDAPSATPSAAPTVRPATTPAEAAARAANTASITTAASPSSLDEAAQAEATAALLALGGRFDTTSRLLTVAALLALVFAPLLHTAPAPPDPPFALHAALLFAVLAGFAEHVLALRTTFDQPIFAAWGARWRAGDAQPEADLAAFDQALASAGLRAARPGSPRPLRTRIAGARRLLRRQGLCLMLQAAAWLVAALTVLLS